MILRADQLKVAKNRKGRFGPIHGVEVKPWHSGGQQLIAKISDDRLANAAIEAVSSPNPASR